MQNKLNLDVNRRFLFNRWMGVGISGAEEMKHRSELRKYMMNRKNYIENRKIHHSIKEKKQKSSIISSNILFF